MPIAISNFHAQWDENFLCTDACLSGYAVVESCHPAEDTASIGRLERPDGRPVLPREQALHTCDVFSDPLTVKPLVDGEVFADYEMDPGFLDVPSRLLSAQDWKLLWRSPIYQKEPVHLIEARSILGALKHRCRDHRRHGKRLVILNDSMGVVLAIQKGRCSSYPLLRLVRRVSAHGLAAGIRLTTRWIPILRGIWLMRTAAIGSQARLPGQAKKGISTEKKAKRVVNTKERGSVGKQQDEGPSVRRHAELTQEGQINIPSSRSSTKAAHELHLQSLDQFDKGSQRTGHAETGAASQEDEGYVGRAQHFRDEERPGSRERTT